MMITCRHPYIYVFIYKTFQHMLTPAYVRMYIYVYKLTFVCMNLIVKGRNHLEREAHKKTSITCTINLHLFNNNQKMNTQKRSQFFPLELFCMDGCQLPQLFLSHIEVNIFSLSELILYMLLLERIANNGDCKRLLVFQSKQMLEDNLSV